MPSRFQQIIADIRRHFRNRKFRAKIAREKRTKYLFDRKAKRKGFSIPWKNIFRRVHARQESVSRFVNTFHHFTVDRPNLSIPMIITALILIGACVFVIFFSPYFAIAPSEVVIERRDTLSDINIAYKAIDTIYGQSIFFLRPSKVADLIESLEKNIKTVDVSRLFPNGLKIVIESYPPEFTLTLPGARADYIITANGVLIYDKNPSADLLKLVLVDHPFIESGFFDYRQAVNPTTMAKVISLRDRFAKKIPGVPITKIALFTAEREVHISLESGTVVILSVDTTDALLDALASYHASTHNILGTGELVYTDARDPKRLFVCREHGPCEKNLFRIYGFPYSDK